jgi:hypothetical protein
LNESEFAIDSPFVFRNALRALDNQHIR